MPPERVV